MPDLDDRGHLFVSSTKPEIAEVEREDQRERLRGHLAAPRARGRAAASPGRRDPQRQKERMAQRRPRLRAQYPPTEAEVQAGSDRVMRELGMILMAGMWGDNGSTLLARRVTSASPRHAVEVTTRTHRS